MDVLTVTPCSLASANQRAGRAGRTAPGKCLRLYPASALPTNNARSPMPVTTPPELVRSDVSGYLLQLKALGIENLAKFDFMSPPPADMMVRALEFLYSLKALDDEARLTPLGERIAELPLDPMMATIVSRAPSAAGRGLLNAGTFAPQLTHSSSTVPSSAAPRRSSRLRP